MPWQKPAPSDVWRAVDVYLQHAYAGSQPPAAVRARLDKLRAAGDEHLFDSELLERNVKATTNGATRPQILRVTQDRGIFEGRLLEGAVGRGVVDD